MAVDGEFKFLIQSLWTSYIDKEFDFSNNQVVENITYTFVKI